ncbi:zinc finger protein 568-like isoform X1 [Ostrinia furnacalis]|uniref:zinc finger protein 568-like isoform X1 n=1 Tax=Ostrinia furnacalis TaxID=93504 RepID=UPI00103F5197|nr:zinc finger protein 568-like isoform X1 [Ostrinia furnacalis]
MCGFKVCRICLRNDGKFYHLQAFDLHKFYAEVTNKPLNIKDGLPEYLCYECAALLHKYHRFREKCHQGDKMFQNMLRGGPLTYEICEINRKINLKLRPKFITLEILNITDRVKTYTFKHENPANIKVEVINEDFTEGPFSDDEIYNKDPESDPVGEDDAFDHFENTANSDDEDKKDFIISENSNNVLQVDEPEIPIMEDRKAKVTLTVESVKGLAKTAKPKKRANTKQARKPRKNTKQTSKKIKIDSGDESDDIELSKIKSSKPTAVMTPATKKTYKFNKPIKGVYENNFEFLQNTENWKRSQFSDEEAMEAFNNRALEKKYIHAPFKCSLCFKGFSQKSMLDRHIAHRHNEAVGPCVCRFCKMRFKSNYFVTKHMRQHYNKYECLRCGLVCDLESTALFHEEYHRNVIRKCPHCEREFKHMSSFYSHLRTHRSKHLCALCGESFVSQLGLHMHRKAKHREVTQTTNVAPEGDRNSWYCGVCKINFECKTAYEKHLSHSALHTEENEKLSEYATENREKQDKRITETKEPDPESKGLINRRSNVEKELCAVRKSAKTRLSTRSTLKKPTTCQHCNESFESHSSCLRHHLAEHRGKPFYAERVICEICGASLALGSVAAHLNQHTRSKMYTCDTCGRSFTTSNMLKNHLVTHTGERNFPCTLCDKRFTQNGSLSLHYRTFHLKQPYPKRNRRKNIVKEEE